MVRTQTKMSRVLAIVLAAILAIGMLAGFAASVKADAASGTYDAPTQAMDVDDSIITATAHRAASPVLGMMGLNAKSGFGMINGSAPTDLAEAQTKAALGIWGTNLNDSPDPYYWNYFYNFYAEANNLEKSNDALINSNVAASPSQYDKNLVEEYGNVSVSLYTRPEVVIGTAAGSMGWDTSGYDGQLATIHSFTKDSPYYQEGDEDYDPYLVPYVPTTLNDMIASVKLIGDAMDEITMETGKTGRYGSGSMIAQEYEEFIYGFQAYVLSQISEKKTVAVVREYDADAKTFTLADASTQEATSSNRFVEYTDIVCDNIADELGTTTATFDQIAGVDAIIIFTQGSESFKSSNEAGTVRELIKDCEGYNEDMIILDGYPNSASLYGVTMNSVENAMGMAYHVAAIYKDEIGIEPVEICAYYYEKFYHITDLQNLKDTIAVNFSKVTLPEGYSVTLPDSYDSYEIGRKIAQGINYYLDNEEEFADTYIAKADWDPARVAFAVFDIEISDDESMVIYDEDIKSAQSITIPEEEAWIYNGTVKNWGKAYYVKDILAQAGIDTTGAHGLKITATDGFVSGYSVDELDNLIIFDMGEFCRAGSLGTPGTYGLGLYAEGGTAGNKWGTDIASMAVAKDHVEFYKKGYRHYCVICGESEQIVDGVYEWCGTVAQNGLANSADKNGDWIYYIDDKQAADFTGVVPNNYGWWYVKDGKVDFTATGIYQNANGWWYVKDGKVDFTAAGIYQNENGWWRVVNGKVDFTANGIYQNANGWWKTTNGKVTFNENGVFQNENGWWKVENSKVNFSFTGLASNSNGTWYIEGGKVNFGFTGNYQGRTVVNGRVTA